jgi:hypothetical protein
MIEAVAVVSPSTKFDETTKYFMPTLRGVTDIFQNNQ